MFAFIQHRILYSVSSRGFFNYQSELFLYASRSVITAASHTIISNKNKFQYLKNKTERQLNPQYLYIVCLRITIPSNQACANEDVFGCVAVRPPN